MRGYAGIYALYHGSKLYYVGLTKNLFGRVRWHLRDRHARKWDSFVILTPKRFIQRLSLHRQLYRTCDHCGHGLALLFLTF